MWSVWNGERFVIESPHLLFLLSNDLKIEIKNKNAVIRSIDYYSLEGKMAPEPSSALLVCYDSL